MAKPTATAKDTLLRQQDIQQNLTREPSGMIDDFFGLLSNKTTKVATLEEIEDATAGGWAGER